MPVGQIFEKYGDVPHVYDERKTELSHFGEEVLLIYLWTSWCPPAHKVITEAQ